MKTLAIRLFSARFKLFPCMIAVLSGLMPYLTQADASNANLPNSAEESTLGSNLDPGTPPTAPLAMPNSLPDREPASASTASNPSSSTSEPNPEVRAAPELAR